jgi:hypothetical protein
MCLSKARVDPSEAPLRRRLLALLTNIGLGWKRLQTLQLIVLIPEFRRNFL